MVIVGVVALQGAVREHVELIERLGASAVRVRTLSDLDTVGALVLPGGESTAMARLARPSGLLSAIRRRVDDGLPVLGTCAGLILLADRVADPEALAGLPTVGGLDVTVRRNAYGAQLASGVADLDLRGGATARGVFIRAPRIEETGPDVEVVAARDGEPVAVRQGTIIAATYHPELAGDTFLHALLLGAMATPSSHRTANEVTTRSSGPASHEAGVVPLRTGRLSTP
ncbi:pyridoxal 5'-phosphate synthase glutaminase subunit PdxT [Tessaracoccus sp. ZS01]|nr:pyridoxal 5'-phosphate synthase glutaminase subunit PdxT [Tessaracoccus sp. ZS01]